MTLSTELRWTLDDIGMAGTFTRPDGAGPFPAVVLVAGSGPTDRDWTSPLLPGTNGSARLIAEALAARGIASLRYDKRASGPDARENVPRLIGLLSMAAHREELEAAVRALAAQDQVDSTRIVGLGNSEGCLHVLHYALADEPFPFAGIVLTAPPGRAVRDVLMMQLGLQLRAAPDGEELLALVREAADRYDAGEPMDPDPRVPEGVRAVLASFEAPVNLPLARELWAEDATTTLAEVRVPTLVLLGGKDLQVDPEADGGPLRHAAEGRENIRIVLLPEANHVLKEDRRPLTEIVPGTGYNEEGTRLDPELLDVVGPWLESVFARQA
ncbi:pimeloyl-ACP methyl ester carboxylesterase [Microbacterium resistens]|uniref:Pimeloyl-ACP methyl ester carboxylesterase n=1 Tax=Microbacterium resistens TaxID=156977 RepID=A0ABU1SFM4_9MICO|nr:alpha/beta fold hydrolase [Microbacterium resistens]MDR6868416.1 pimeloyl-ACP methyl ester carboxylesterase [Microbacterium resistens]